MAKPMCCNCKFRGQRFTWGRLTHYFCNNSNADNLQEDHGPPPWYYTCEHHAPIDKEQHKRNVEKLVSAWTGERASDALCFIHSAVGGMSHAGASRAML